MSPARAPFATLFATSLVVGCTPTADGTAKVRAANDFSCSEDQVTVRSIGGTTFRADGCGQTALYDCIASDGSRGAITAYLCRPENITRPSRTSSTGPTPAAQ